MTKPSKNSSVAQEVAPDEERELLRELMRTNPARAREWIASKTGGANALESLGYGVMSGFSHGLSDDGERMAGNNSLTGQGLAGGRRRQMDEATGVKNAMGHMRAEVSNPPLFRGGQVLGALGSGLAARVGIPALGRMRADSIRSSGSKNAYGSGALSPKLERRAQDAEKIWSRYGMDDTRTRSAVIDAGHGLGFGYGGTEVNRDENLFSAERGARAAAGAVAGVALAPLTASAGMAASNVPLAFRQRRFGSTRMLEPPGVTRDNPGGRPRRAIDIVRSLDAANDTDVAGDRSAPLASQAPNMRSLVDKVIASTPGAANEARETSAQALLERFPALPPDRGADHFVNQMVMAVIERDVGPGRVESWGNHVLNASKQDPTIWPRMQHAIARQLAQAERSGENLYEVSGIRQFIHKMGMKGTQETPGTGARAAAMTPQRVRTDEAIRRQSSLPGRANNPLGTSIPLRPRHAESLARELTGYEPGPYAGRELARRGPPLVARGDDQAHYYNPLDFFSRSRHVPEDAVNAAAITSAPSAAVAEMSAIGPGSHALFSDGDRQPGYVDRFGRTERQRDRRQTFPPPRPPVEPVIDANYQRIPSPAPQAGGTALAPTRREPSNSVALLQRKLNELGFRDPRAPVDGVIDPGGPTEAAMKKFVSISDLGLSGMGDPRIGKYLELYANGQLPQELAAKIDAALMD